jgi:hypothetical protein
MFIDRIKMGNDEKGYNTLSTAFLYTVKPVEAK